jgi:hypothetical protein
MGWGLRLVGIIDLNADAGPGDEEQNSFFPAYSTSGSPITVFDPHGDVQPARFAVFVEVNLT